MKRRLRIIYVPGFGDNTAVGQQIALRSWYLWGVRPEMVRMLWQVNEPWEQKINRLLARIDELTKAGYCVGLVGASAGGAAVINAFAQRQDQVVGCVIVAGKIRGADSYGNSAYHTAVAGSELANQTLTAASRARILSRYSLTDQVVPASDSKLNGAHNEESTGYNHISMIARQLTIGAPSFIKFLKKCRI